MKERGILFSTADRSLRAAAGRLRVTPEAYVDALNSGRKICGGCRLSVPIEHFSKDRSRIRSRCKPCDAKARAANYEAQRPQQRERQLKYQRENRERLYAYNARWSRERNAALRAELIAAYGSACACCGERHPLFLDLDHVENDGAAHRREVGNSTQVMLQLREQGWPRGRYQLLCCNCNQGKARNGGVCPHANVQS